MIPAVGGGWDYGGLQMCFLSDGGGWPTTVDGGIILIRWH